MKTNVFGARLKGLRSQTKLSQANLAKKLECATSVIGDIERGGRNPSKMMALKLADFFDTNPTFWLNEEEEAENFNININDEIKRLYNQLLSSGKIKSAADLKTNDFFKTATLNLVENFLTLEEIKKEQD